VTKLRLNLACWNYDRTRALADRSDGDQFSIADIAWYPWIEYHEWQGQALSSFPHVNRWYQALRERPAVLRGASIPWPYTECGTSEMGRRAKALIERRLKDPAFALSANPEDAGLANLAI